jgi:hypothetical protein
MLRIGPPNQYLQALLEKVANLCMVEFDTARIKIIIYV